MGRDIPDSVKMRLFDESGLQCAYCGHRDGLNLTQHHLVPVRDGGLATYENLLTLCHNCHVKAENDGITVKDLRRIKRHFVHRHLTTPAIYALKTAALSCAGLTFSQPYLVGHLLDWGYLEEEDTPVWEQNTPLGLTAGVAYRITEKGRQLCQEWILRSDD